jgi:hypothetical protein
MRDELPIKKTKEMEIIFRWNKTSLPLQRSLGNQSIVTTYKYLGIEIDNKLKFSDSAFAKMKKLQQRMFFYYAN